MLVESAHRRVRALYEQWGYESVGRSQPYPDGPLYDVMLRLEAGDAAAAEELLQ